MEDSRPDNIDPLRDPKTDYFRPPSIPTEVQCYHCRREFDSWKMVWREMFCEDGEIHGFWCCPIDGCGGRGFGYDIWPTEPDYIDPDGRDFGSGEDEPADVDEELAWLEEQWQDEDDPPSL